MPVDVRVLSATHRRLDELVASGKFREDLYYRINVIELRVPALRERLDDVPPLVDMLLDRVAGQIGVARPQISDEAHGQAAVVLVSRATCASSRTSSSAR